jgi:hypothetical protein
MRHTNGELERVEEKSVVASLIIIWNARRKTEENQNKIMIIAVKTKS